MFSTVDAVPSTRASTVVRSPSPVVSAWRVAAIAGLAVGALDGADGAVYFGLAHGLNPLQVFQFIASGALGAAAFQGGLATVALGAVIHFGLAFGFAGVFVAAYLRSAAVRRHWVVAGLGYGLAVWAFMTFVALPLSAIAQAAPTLGDILNGAIGHAITVGFASAYVSRRTLGR